MSKKQYLTLEEIKAEELKILNAFAAFCKMHELKYSLAGGTLLGAVRHKGFIPWDDDIDVLMGRPWYDRFLSFRDKFESEHGYRVVAYRGTRIDATPYIKIVNDSILVKADIESSLQKLWIDVFPVDGLPEDETDLECLYSRASRLRKAIIVSGVNPSSGSTKAKKIAKVAARALLSVPAVVAEAGAKLDKLGRAIPYGSTPYVGGLTWGLYGSGERVSYEGFENQTSLPFENYEFTCMSCWREYLTGLYGDYMKLPPVNMRVSHDVTAWRVEDGGI